jgi:hypothetical protein
VGGWRGRGVDARQQVIQQVDARDARGDRDVSDAAVDVEPGDAERNNCP